MKAMTAGVSVARAILGDTMYVHPSRANRTTLDTLESPKKAKTTKTSTSSNRNYSIGFIVGLIIFIPTLYIAHKHQLTGMQARIFYDLNNMSNSFKVPALWLTEGLGSGPIIAICVLVPLAFKRFRLAWRYLVTAGGAGVVMEIGKHIAKEPRPFVLLHGHIHQRAVEVGLNSFPSGHETIGTAMALTTWLITPKKWRWATILWIIIVGVSRIYLGDHTPNDVLGGFAIGLMAVCFLQLLPEKFIHRLYLYKGDELLQKGR